MAYERLQALGKEKFGAITNKLMRDVPALQIARLIQQEWGDFAGTAEKTLSQQLNRLKLDMQKGAFGTGEKAKEALKEDGKIDIKMLRGSTIDVMAEMTSLVNLQRKRIQTLFEKEQEIKMPLSGLNVVITDMKDLLVATQKIRFDLGIDDFKGVVPGTRVAVEQVTKPDGTMGQRVIVDAVNLLEDVFERRKIPAAELTNGANV